MKPEGLTRRDFLGVTGAITGALAGAGLIGHSASADDKKDGAGMGPGPVEFVLRVNGKDEKVTAEPRTTLLDVLRDNLGLTGGKRACDRGECGSCTVHVDGKPVYACMMLALQARGREIRTIEGLGKGDALHPVQQAFVDHDGYQCGFCTPGQVMTAAALLEKNASPTLEEVKAGMCGNVCRCAAYNKIFEAVLAAAKK